jgi:hypothetical protein
LAFDGAVAEAQQAGKIPRIGYISGTYNPSNPGPYVEALRRGMRELGYTEGKNFIEILEWYYKGTSVEHYGME